jgi:hypothetical protein
MSRILTDETGAYDLTRVIAVIPNTVKAQGQPARTIAHLLMDGGQVCYTNSEYETVATTWVDALIAPNAPPIPAVTLVPDPLPPPKGKP